MNSKNQTRNVKLLAHKSVNCEWRNKSNKEIKVCFVNSVKTWSYWKLQIFIRYVDSLVNKNYLVQSNWDKQMTRVKEGIGKTLTFVTKPLVVSRSTFESVSFPSKPKGLSINHVTKYVFKIFIVKPLLDSCTTFWHVGFPSKPKGLNVSHIWKVSLQILTLLFGHMSSHT